ncbi:hypothetical protein P8605_00600 [Streptomyces sp. T-3]|nr:hypothetical protein [Streptomyces sp. T-3]
MPPPTWLRIEGVVVAAVGTGAVVGCGVAGAATAVPALRTGAVGLVAAFALMLYLVITRAGQILTGAVTALGVCLALLVPRASAEMVLALRGDRTQVVVTSVAATRDADRYLCSVRYGDGTPVATKLWRGCDKSVDPGESIGMVYDPGGWIPPRGITGAEATWRTAGQGAGLALLLALLSYSAVVRSIRRGR